MQMLKGKHSYEVLRYLRKEPKVISKRKSSNVGRLIWIVSSETDFLMPHHQTHPGQIPKARVLTQVASHSPDLSYSIFFTNYLNTRHQRSPHQTERHWSPPLKVRDSPPRSFFSSRGVGGPQGQLTALFSQPAALWYTMSRMLKVWCMILLYPHKQQLEENPSVPLVASGCQSCHSNHYHHNY